jgi:8-oxo-dGTP pyrophosphatase MutT (NUDIX family)
MRSSRKWAGAKRVQYAALPYRINGRARAEVMLVTSRQSRRWIIPKGWPHKGQAPHRSAAREAYEEAGVIGSVMRRCIGSFSYEKRLSKGHAVECEVRVFALKVKRQNEEWPEKHERRVKWLSARAAARVVREPMLRKIILRLARTSRHRSICRPTVVFARPTTNIT